jgi:hypothetical protein
MMDPQLSKAINAAVAQALGQAQIEVMALQVQLDAALREIQRLRQAADPNPRMEAAA